TCDRERPTARATWCTCGSPGRTGGRAPSAASGCWGSNRAGRCSGSIRRLAAHEAAVAGHRPGMTRYGYFLSSEEFAPAQLLEQARAAEQAGFEALWISDHFHPWNEEQGQSAFVW